MTTIKTEQNTVIVLPQSDADTLCVDVTGLVRREDHQKNLRGMLEKIVKNKASYNLLIRYTADFKGWEMDAAESSMQSIIDLGKFARKIAYVNPPQKKIFQNKLSAPLFTGEIRYFALEDMEEALNWVKS